MKQITKAQVYDQMLKTCKRKSIHMISPKKGKSIVPKTIDDIPPSIRKSSSKLYRSSYSAIYNKLNYAAKKQDQRARVVTKKETPIVNAKKLVINLSESMTATITDKGLITVDFK